LVGAFLGWGVMLGVMAEGLKMPLFGVDEIVVGGGSLWLWEKVVERKELEMTEEETL
jgi:hypothetical protein